MANGSVPISIIPATALRDSRKMYRSNLPQDVPINAVYYNPYYAPAQRVSRRDERPPPVYYHQRSRTAPPPPSQAPLPPQYYARSQSSETFAQYRAPLYYGPAQSVSGPRKYPAPMYTKPRVTSSRRVYPTTTEKYHHGIDYIDTPQQILRPFSPPAYAEYPRAYSPVVLPRYRPSRRFWNEPAYSGYAPSSVGQPPGQKYRSRSAKASQKYPFALRLLLKLAQVVVGTAIVLLILWPSFDDQFLIFFAQTSSQAQIFVLILVLISTFASFIFLFTINYSRSAQGWRNADATTSAVVIVLYVIAAGLEIWYALCYHPFGQAHPRACRLPEWAVAAALSIINIVLYAVDFAFALRTGVSLL